MYPIKETVSQTRHKVSLMIQAHLGSVQFPDSSDAARVRRQLMVERKLVFERLNRLVRAVVDCKGYDRDSVSTRTALELARALAAGSWEGRATQLTQVPNIGPVGMRKLASKNIRTVLELADKNYDEIERLMSRQPPFGKNLQAHLEKFPRLDVDLAVVSSKIQPRSKEPVVIDVRATLRYLNRKGPPNWLNRVPVLTFLAESSDGTLVYFWRGSMRKLDKQSGLELGFSIGLRNARDRVVCHFSCEEIVGTMVSKALDHKLPASVFPPQRTPNTRSGPDRKGNDQDYSDDDGIDDSELILAAEQALAYSSMRQGARTMTDEYPPLEDLLETEEAERQPANRMSGTKSNRQVNSQHDGDDVDGVQTSPQEPVQLPNGKWQCNHNCSGGAPTRSGKPCSHRCCKEGLDRPRKRLSQKPKRKRDESTTEDGVESRTAGPSLAQHRQFPQLAQKPAAGTQEKRQKLHSTSRPVGEKQVHAPKASVGERNTRWEDMDLDTMELECIDLSFTDDEDDTVHRRHGDVHRASSKADVDARDITSARNDDGMPVSGSNPKQTRTIPTSGHEKSASAATFSAKEDNYFSDEDFAFAEEPLLLGEPTTQNGATLAFKSGANDEVLCQGIANTFGESGSGSSQSGASDTCSGATAKSKNPSSGSLIEDCDSEMLHGSSRDGVGTSTYAAVQEGNSPQESREPAWVAEFDSEIVDMFRGYVTFV